MLRFFYMLKFFYMPRFFYMLRLFYMPRFLYMLRLFYMPRFFFILYALSVELAHRGRVEHDLTDLLRLGIREVVSLHIERLKVGLPGEKDEQRIHALIPIVHIDPFSLNVPNHNPS